MSILGIPSIMTTQGLQPQQPTDIRAKLLSIVGSMVPGYTATLPGSLIEDMSSTAVGAIVLCDSFRHELVNSITPWGANEFLLNQLGNIYGVKRGGITNTSVMVVFTGNPSTVIPKGFTVSDGTHQYVLQNDAIIGGGGTSLASFCVAVLPGTWPVPANSVTTLSTQSPPGTTTLTVTNPTTGTPSTALETLDSYRQRVVRAGLAVSQGMAGRLRTLLTNVEGVDQRLVAIRQRNFPPGGWEIIVGGGDPYQVGLAILRGIFDVSTLVGSTMDVTNITLANPGVVTTRLNHGLQNNETIILTGVLGMIQVNGILQTVTVIDSKNFSISDTTQFAPYSSGGEVTPNLRNVTVSLNDFPDTYTVVYVNPPQQVVAIALLWNTDSPNFVSPAAFAQLAQPALVNYVNGITTGQPMNLFEMQKEVQDAIAGLLPPELLTRMAFAVSIDGVGVLPETGTGIIAGDDESYFLTNSSLVTVNQG